MATQNYAYKGRGSVLMGLIPSGPVMEVGNTEELKISIESETEELEDYESPAGGTAATSTWIKRVTVSLKLRNISPENLAKAYLGAVSAISGATISAANHTAYKGAHIVLDHIKPGSVVVTNQAESTTYVVGTDYTVTNTGIYIAPNSNIGDASVIRVAYTHGNEQVVEALTSASQEYKIVFSGHNTAQSGRARVVILHRVRLSPASESALITGSFAELDLTGTLIKDASQPSGKSQYFKEILEPAA